MNSPASSTSPMMWRTTTTTMASTPLLQQHTNMTPEPQPLSQPPEPQATPPSSLPPHSMIMTEEQRVDLYLSQPQQNTIPHQAHPFQHLNYGPSVQAETLDAIQKETLDTIQASFNNLSLDTDDQSKSHQNHLHQPLLQDIPMQQQQQHSIQQETSNNKNFRPTPKNIIEKNLIYVSEEIKSFFSRGTLLIKLISTSVILMYLFMIIVGDEQIAYSLTLIPGRLYSSDTFLWSALTFLTCPFVEFHLWQVALDVISIYLIDNLVKPLWGQVIIKII